MPPTRGAMSEDADIAGNDRGRCIAFARSSPCLKSLEPIRPSRRNHDGLAARRHRRETHCGTSRRSAACLAHRSEAAASTLTLRGRRPGFRAAATGSRVPPLAGASAQSTARQRAAAPSSHSTGRNRSGGAPRTQSPAPRAVPRRARPPPTLACRHRRPAATIRARRLGLPDPNRRRPPRAGPPLREHRRSPDRLWLRGSRHPDYNANLKIYLLSPQMAQLQTFFHSVAGYQQDA